MARRLLVCGLLLAAGCGGQHAAAPERDAARAPTRLYGIAGPPPSLYAVDRRSLHPIRGRSIPLTSARTGLVHSFGWSIAPDGARAALGSDLDADLRIFDLGRMRVAGDLRLLSTGSVFATTWATSRRLFAVVLDRGCCGLGGTTLVTVDAAQLRVIRRTPLRGSLQGGEPYRGGLVLVLGPTRSIGSSRVAVVDRLGRARLAPLEGIRSGLSHSGDTQSGRFVTHSWNPGIAVDPKRGRAFVVQAGAPVAEVDLRSLRVSYHRLSRKISLLGRLRDWLEPRAEAKADDGPTRQAVWLGHDRVAVSGWDDHAFLDAQGRQQQTSTPAGVTLVDSRRWSARRIDGRASRLVLAGDTLLALGALWDSPSGKVRNAGLTAFALDGTKRYRIAARKPVFGAYVVGGRAYLDGPVLDVHTGRVVGHARVQTTLLGLDPPFWY